jgi:hypothetical protein
MTKQFSEKYPRFLSALRKARGVARKNANGVKKKTGLMLQARIPFGQVSAELA